jgi:cation transport protein ChaC
VQLPAGNLWIFGYGSLLWRPGFAYLEKQRARVFGYHRSLCVWSWHHRGQPESPGLVFGLDAGGSVLGMAYRVAANAREATLDYLYGREMVTPVYAPRLVRAETTGGTVQAVTFAVDRNHDQYAGRLPFAKALAVVRDARGKSGHNREYVLKAASTLDELAVRDPAIQRLASELHPGGTRV